MNGAELMCAFDKCRKPFWVSIYYVKRGARYCSRKCSACAAQSDTVVTRFWERVAKTPSGCWFWEGAVDAEGYGKLMIAGKCRKAHQVAFEFAGGERVSGNLGILHSCDNRRCVNPSHLRLGEQCDNIKDMIIRNRMPRGERRAWAKLTDNAVRTIRSEAAAGVKLGVLATRFGVHEGTIGSVVRRETWTHVL